MGIAFLAAQRSKDPATQVGWVCKLFSLKIELIFISVRALWTKRSTSSASATMDSRSIAVTTSSLGPRHPMTLYKTNICMSFTQKRTVIIVVMLLEPRNTIKICFWSHSQQEQHQCPQLYVIRGAVPVQRVRQDDHTVSHQGSCVSLRQACWQTANNSVQKDARRGERCLPPVHASEAQNYHWLQQNRRKLTLEWKISRTKCYQ